MKARLIPIYFPTARDADFDEQLKVLKELLANEADILEPVALGDDVPEADAVIFPQLVGEAYRQIENFKKIDMPLIACTSEFGTVAMWDWEIVTFLKAAGLKVFAPYTIELTRTICRTLALKREMKQTKFLIFQDDPGSGFQGYICKRFYWWEDECTQAIKDKFGITIEKRSFKQLAAEAKLISDEEAQACLDDWQLNTLDLGSRPLLSGAKLYLAIVRAIGDDTSIKGVGLSCPNESAFTDTTPCLAYSMLYEKNGIFGICEADTVSLLTNYIINSSLDAPIMMSNVYPFLIGMAALKHEKIQEFPNVPDPEHHLLVAHCGYFGCMPRAIAKEWTLRPRVLEIVDDNATSIDARFPEGDITITKLHPSMGKLQIIEGELEEYVQYPGSDCRNGGLIRIKNGYALMNDLYSHHSCFTPAKIRPELEIMCKVLDIEAEAM